MIQIRNSVFETNSSSAHTIAVKNKDQYDYDLKCLLNDDGTFELKPYKTLGALLVKKFDEYGNSKQVWFSTYLLNLPFRS